jgi:phenylalanyl-tRNA synthetase beta chain
MKASLNWVKQFTDVPLGVDELVTKIGAQLGAVEEVIDVGAKYRGIVIARVVWCEKHPNADKLRVCLLDDGNVVKNVPRNEDGTVQVVCGAPNVREGMLVVWIPPGVTVPATVDKDPFVLEARELRGVISNGMLASASELAISDDHSGLLEVDIDLQPGTSFAEAYELDDYVIDIENKMFTHRPDLFGILGVAREIAGIQDIEFKSPDWYLQPLDRIKPGKSRLPLEVRNEIPDLVPRFTAIAMAEVSVKPSPLIIQTYLSRVGIRPINNIVDMTNYLMVLTGQPMHAYDYDKVKAQDEGADKATILVRKPQKGEKLALLNGKIVEPEDGIMIASSTKLIGIGGVMGGAGTEVDENTKNIIIECANFDMYSIRRTAMKHGLFTDAVTRFTKGQSPRQNDILLEEAVATAQYVSGAHVASDVFDLKSDVKPQTSVEVTSDFISSRLGLDTDAEEITGRLKNVEFDVQSGVEALKVTPPYWRTDIEIPEDIVEEVGRLIGYDKLPLELPSRTIKPAQKNSLLEFKSRVREILAKAGANEVLTYSFVHGDLLDKIGQDKEKAFKLSNALSPDLQYYRLSLTPSLLEKVHPNIKAGFNEFAIFEIGKAHNKDAITDVNENVPREFENLALVVAKNDKNSEAVQGAAYYKAKYYLDYLAKELGVELRYESLDAEPEYIAAKPFDYIRSARVYIKGEKDKLIGLVGEFKPAVARSLKLPKYAAGFEVGITLKLLGTRRYRPISRYPKVQQDITLKVPHDVLYGEINDLLNDELKELNPPNAVAHIEPLDIYQKGSAKHLTFRLTIASYERTLTDKEVNKLLDELATKAHQKFGAERI